MLAPVPDTRELAERLHAARPDDDDARIEALIRSRLFGPALAPALVVGRFTLLERIGRGGMGEVYAAYDPALDRRVAVKLLRDDAPRGPRDSAERGALLREARAAARLAHPSVVAVHEVGELADGAVYIAMEHIDGLTLRAWLRAPRSVDAILRVFVQAGRGLAAAHDAGLVHRDFKPENLLISGDGEATRARVVDFGLARASALPTADPLTDRGLAPESAVMGTPAYMSPEQLEGRALDPRSDLFAFCVALHEALTGHHPFGADRPGASAQALLARVLAGERPAGERQLPGWLRAILRRGLAADPARRPPSMHALLRELQATPARRRRRALAVAAAALVLLSSALTVAGQGGLARSTCADADAELRGVWDPALRTQAAAAFARAGLAHAGEVWQRIEPRLDDYARAWVVSREQTCQGRLGAAALSPELAVLRGACLDRRRAELRGLTELLRDADRTTIGAAIVAVDQLTPPSACDDLESLGREDAGGLAAEALRRELLRLRSRARAGHGREIAGEADAAAAAAEALGAPALRAEAHLLRALLDEDAGDYDDAAARLESAVLDAVAARHDRLHAEAATRLVWLHAVRRLDFTAARAWIARADAAIHAARDDPRLAARLLDHRGALASLTHDPAAAVELHRAAIALRERHAAPDDVEMAIGTGNLGLALLERGEHDEATRLIEDALARFRAAFGPGHPDYAATLANLGEAHLAAGDPARAEALLAEALAIKERAFGPDHVALVLTLSGLGSAASALGRSDDARAHYHRALAIGEREHGPESPRIEAVLHNLAFESWILGDHAAVVRHARRALDIQTRLHGERGPILAPTLELLARGHLGLHDLPAAVAAIDRALDLATDALAPPIRGEIYLSAAVIAAAAAAPPHLIHPRARTARALLGPHPSPEAAAELAALLPAP